jgi:hypothetical protein
LPEEGGKSAYGEWIAGKDNLYQRGIHFTMHIFLCCQELPHQFEEIEPQDKKPVANADLLFDRFQIWIFLTF